MADRLFAAALLLVAIGYTYMAAFVIRAPFQYDPLGPETWPQLVGTVAILCTAYLVIRPDVARFEMALPTWARIAILVALLYGYAQLFEPAGFVLSTFGFCTILSLMLGARILPALAFGAVTGLGGYYLATELLALNLPAGVLAPYLP